MLGFMKKDLAIIKSNGKFLGLLIILYLFLAFSGEMDIAFIIPFLGISVMLSTFSYDNFNKWDLYASSFPNGKFNMVRAKYLLTIILIILMAMFITIVSIIIFRMQNKMVDIMYLLVLSGSLIIGSLLCLIIMYPCIYKFGLEKTRIGMFVGFVLMAILVSSIITFIDVYNLLNNKYIYLIIILAIVLLTLISYKISIKINLNKEY